MKPLKDKVIWITGASSGIGESLAYLLSAEGSRLILSSRHEQALQRVKEKCLPNEVMVLPFDLSRMTNASHYADQVTERFGRLDILINNAGISQRSLSKDTLPEVDRYIMEVNFFGAACLTKAALPTFVRQKQGHIVVTSSICGKFGAPLRSAYAASKHALFGFFESLRSEVRRDNIQVTLVCPGRIRTPVSINALTQDGRRHDRMDPGQARGIPAEVCARRMITAIKKGKKEVYIGREELIMVYLRRFFPSLFFKLIGTIKTT